MTLKDIYKFAASGCKIDFVRRKVSCGTSCDKCVINLYLKKPNVKHSGLLGTNGKVLRGYTSCCSVILSEVMKYPNLLYCMEHIG